VALSYAIERNDRPLFFRKIRAATEFVMGSVSKESRAFTCAKGREFTVSYVRIDGGRPGPALALIGGQHGMEHIGPVVLKEMVHELAERDFRGTVSICPCANPLALELDFEYYPENEDLAVLDGYFYSRFRHDYCPYGMERSKGPNYYNMNRLWNRDVTHGVAGQVTQWLWDEIVSGADVTIDFHCLQAEKPLIFNWHKDGIPLAACFGIQAIYPHGAGDDFLQGNLGYQGGLGGSRAFCVEFSRQHGYKDEYALGKQGIRNIMAAIGMVEDDVVLERPVYEIVSSIATKAEATGHIHYLKDEYEPVLAGEKIFEISSLESLDLLQVGVSTIDGIVGRRTRLPIAKPGENVLAVQDVRKVMDAGSYPAGCQAEGCRVTGWNV
jgi:predicted deacylase